MSTVGKEMGQALFKQVRRFISDVTLKPLQDITPETNLYFDLGLTLETAPAFFAQFAAEFEVDLQGMDLQPYFAAKGYDGSGGDLGTALMSLLFLASDRHTFHGVKPLLVRDLVAMARAKKWGFNP